MRVAGIMSGTSLDGIDVAIVDIAGQKIRPVAFASTPYPKDVREALHAVSNTHCHTAEISRLHFLLPEIYADAFHELCRSSGFGRDTVKLIGCHGQTIFHEGDPVRICGRKIASTLQIGDGSVLAELTGIPVVSDFRTRDMAAGGKGAPLVPFFDWVYFRHATRNRVCLNIGGIGNITWLPAGAKQNDVIAFDTGPGNMVMDQLVAHFTRGRKTFDESGRVAARGHVDRALVARLLRDRFYRAAPPKSAGREQYGKDFIERLLATGLPFEDLVATAGAFTVATIVAGIELLKATPDDLIVGGGGAHNPQIMGLLAAYLPHTKVSVTTDHGIDSDAKEAIAFALMAHETWRGRPSNVPSATGARHAVVLGKISR
ncbi:MAG: anhydro-N-acetylmuramic acid kinase [Bryobacteraceae bacterium]